MEPSRSNRGIWAGYLDTGLAAGGLVPGIPALDLNGAKIEVPRQEFLREPTHFGDQKLPLHQGLKMGNNIYC